MSWKKTDLEYWVPDWAWCDMPNPGGKTRNGERCRFCQEVKQKGGATTYKCLIFSKDLYASGGAVQRCGMCAGFNHNSAKTEAPKLESGKNSSLFKCVKRSLKEFISHYKAARKQGLPEYMALDQAQEEVLQQWN